MLKATGKTEKGRAIRTEERELKTQLFIYLTDLFFTNSFSKYLQQLSLAEAKARITEPKSPTRIKDNHLLEPWSATFQDASQQKAGFGKEARIQTKTLRVGCRHTRKWFDQQHTKCLPLNVQSSTKIEKKSYWDSDIHVKTWRKYGIEPLVLILSL